jgi:ketosteroid isomerase-like protein
VKTLATALSLSLAVVLCSCSTGARQPSQAEAENEIAVRTLLSMIGSGDVSDVAGLFHPDAVYDDYANQRQYRGLEEIAGYLAGGTRWATAVSMDVLSVHVSDSLAVAEWVFTGIQDRPIRSFVPVVTGREVVLNGVTILEIEEGRIRRAADYTDALALALQLGGEVRMPGGVVLRQDAAAAAEPNPTDTISSPEEPS